jgi:protein-L-isoaspartate(D-aspartate) O-methyltransferase
MIDVQLARRGIRDKRVLDAISRVPREAFVEPGFEEFAYEDGALPIGKGQTISQPYIVALMLETVELQARDRVLEIGAGSGYAAAVMSQIVTAFMRSSVMDLLQPLRRGVSRHWDIAT